jgi:heat-inducible transcriptional repressor
MSDRKLTDREREILTLVVKAYILDASPVGSRSLTRQFGLSLSPATIRNTMNDLEAAGLLEQPHTSAGRVPTDKGYRVYVDQLMAPVALSSQERAAIREAVQIEAHGRTRDAAAILNQTVRALGTLTHLLAVSLEPSLDAGRFEKLELVALGDRKLLAVLTIEGGFLRTVVLELDAVVDRLALDETARLINERLSGLPMSAIRRSAKERMRDAAGDPKVLKLIVNSSEDLFAPTPADGLVHYWGTPNILSLPEFSSKDRMLSLMGALEQKEIFVRILGQKTGQEGLTITIGEENREGEIDFCSIVASPYSVGDVGGSVGVVGPTRMEYSKLVTLVDYTARLVTEVLGDASERGGRSRKDDASKVTGTE